MIEDSEKQIITHKYFLLKNKNGECLSIEDEIIRMKEKWKDLFIEGHLEPIDKDSFIYTRYETDEECKKRIEEELILTDYLEKHEYKEYLRLKEKYGK